MELTLESLAIILSAVALFVTVIGFFASIKFYRDAVDLQQKANDVLTRVAERTDSLQNHVTGMFDKTLTAAIGGTSRVAGEVQSLEGQLDQSRDQIVSAVRAELGDLGEKQAEQIVGIIERGLRQVEERVASTALTANRVVGESLRDYHGVSEAEMAWLVILSVARNPMSEAEVTSRLDDDVRALLQKGMGRRLATKGLVADAVNNDGDRVYALTALGRDIAMRYLGRR